MARRPVAYENPYTVAVAWIQSNGLIRRATEGTELRGAVSRGVRWYMRRVAQLDPVWGRRLDQLGVTMRQIRWVASPGPRDRLSATEQRYRAMVKFLEGTSGHESFGALCAAHSSFDPVTGEEIPVVPPAEAPAA